MSRSPELAEVAARPSYAVEYIEPAEERASARERLVDYLADLLDEPDEE